MQVVRVAFLQPSGRLRSGWRLLLLVSALLAAVATVGVVQRALGVPDGTEDGVLRPVPVLQEALLGLAAVALVTWLMMRLLDRRSLATMGLPLRRPWLGGLGAGAALGGLPVALTVGVGLVGGSVVLDLPDVSASTVLAVTLPGALGLLIISSMEEVVLRGYSMQLLAEGGGRWLAATVTGALFGLAHTGNPGSNLLGLVNTGVNGILLAWLIMRSGSLWLACGYHAGWNLCGALLFGMRLSGIDVPGALLRTELVGPAWLTGGEYGFEGSVVAGVAELLVLAGAVAIAHRLPGHPEMRVYFAGRRVA